MKQTSHTGGTGMEYSSAPPLKTRKTYLDFIKILAIFMVLFNHTGTKGFTLFTVAQTSALYPLYLFASVFIKTAVPLFFMVSGTLMLGKTETLNELLRRRFFRHLTVLVAASLVLYVYLCLRVNGSGISLTYFLKALYGGNIATPFWYLYTYLAYILMLPLLRKLAQAMSNRDFEYMLILATALGLLKMLEYPVFHGSNTYSRNFSLFIMQNYILYPFMGYYFDQRLQIETVSARKLLALWLVSFAAIAASCLLTHYKCTLTGDWQESQWSSFFEALLMIPTLTVFITVKRWFTRHSIGERAEKTISAIGGTTFGIYLIERICRNETAPVFALLKPYIHTFPACLVWIFSACLLGCRSFCCSRRSRD